MSSLEPGFTALLSIFTGVSSGRFTTTVMTTGVTAVSDPFVVYWHESDLLIFPTEARGSLEAAMVDQETTVAVAENTVPLPPAGNRPGGSSSSDDEPGGLPKGTMGRIAAGVSGLVLLFLFWLLRFWIKRRRSRRMEADASEEDEEKDTGESQAHDFRHVNELPADAEIAAELGTPGPSHQHRSELSATERPIELSTERLSELPADSAVFGHRQDGLHISSTVGDVNRSPSSSQHPPIPPKQEP